MASSKRKHDEFVEQLLQSNSVLHETIIDLYLQVKIRSNDEIDNFDEDQLSKERDRLLKFDSLTVLDYIRTSIEILMQMKLEEDKHGNKGLQPVGQADKKKEPQQIETPSESMKSLDLPPKEYEQQLQQYESEVRNHIKVEQQLKLHIEVLQEKVEETEKEHKLEIKEQEMKIAQFEDGIKTQKDLVEQKEKEIDKLQREIKKYKINIFSSNKPVQAQPIAPQTQPRSSSNSKSPPSHAISGFNKSPYLNDCFYKLIGQSNTAGANSVGAPTSNSSSAKSQGKLGASVGASADHSTDVQMSSQSKKGPKNVNTSAMDSMKLIAAIQRMRNPNGSALSGSVTTQMQSHKRTKSHSNQVGIDRHDKQFQQQRRNYNTDMIQSFNVDGFNTSKQNPQDLMISSNFPPQNQSATETQNAGSMQLIKANSSKLSQGSVSSKRPNSIKRPTTHLSNQQTKDTTALFKKVLLNEIDAHSKKKSKNIARGTIRPTIQNDSILTNSNTHTRVYSIEMMDPNSSSLGPSKTLFNQSVGSVNQQPSDGSQRRHNTANRSRPRSQIVNYN